MGPNQRSTKADLAPLMMVLAFLSGCSGYPSPGGVGYMGTGGMMGMGGMGMGMGGMGMGAMGMPMAMSTSGMGYGGGYIGTDYGTGGMELGTNLGGWGDGLGSDYGQDLSKGSPNDGNPRLTSSYHNTDFDNDRGFAYYHPADPVSPSTP